MVKKLFKTFLLAAFLVTAVHTPIFAEDTKKITLVNMSGRTFWGIHFWPSNIAGIFTEDRLDFNTLKHNEQMKISVPQYKYWDMRIYLDRENNDFWSWQGIDLSTVSRITITARDSKGIAHFD